jgi:hypothetical protein
MRVTIDWIYWPQTRGYTYYSATADFHTYRSLQHTLSLFSLHWSFPDNDF